MKFINIQLSALILLTTCACTSGADIIIPEPLIGKSIACPPNEEIYPVIFIDSIALGSGTNKNIATIMTENGCSTAEELFHKGRGHNEFNWISYSKGSDNSLLILNNPLSGNKLLSMTVINKTKNLTEMKDVKAWKKYDLSLLPPFRNCSNYFISLTDSTVLIPGAPYNDLRHIFSVVNYRNQTVTPLDYWPEQGEESEDSSEGQLPNWPKHAFYTSNCRLFSNGKGHFLYQLMAERYAFIFSIDGEKVNIAKKLYSEIPEYKINKKTGNYKVKYGPKAMITYANKHNIYILLLDSDKNGKLLEEAAPAYGNIVEVYDWDGNKQRVIQLDKYLRHIIVSEDNKTLFAYKDTPEAGQKMWTYDISEQK